MLLQKVTLNARQCAQWLTPRQLPPQPSCGPWYTCTCTLVCAHICTHAYPSRTLVHAHICTHTLHAHAHMGAHTHAQPAWHMCIHTLHAHAHSVHTCTRAHTYTHVHTFLHTASVSEVKGTPIAESCTWAGSSGTFPFQGHLAHRASVWQPDGQGCPGTQCLSEEWTLRNGLICKRQQRGVGSL